MWRHVVDAPFQDDWALIPWQGFSRLEWLLALHVDHPILLTKLLVLAQQSVGGWDVAVHRQINWLLYGLQVAVLALLVARVKARSENDEVSQAAKRWSWVSVVLCATTLSTFNLVNHEWAIQTSYHLFVLFSLLAAMGFAGRVSVARVGLVSVALLLVTQTLAAGLFVAAAGFVLLIAWAVPLRKATPRSHLYAASAVFGVALAVWVATALRYWRGGSRGAYGEELTAGERIEVFVRLLGRALAPEESGAHAVLGVLALLMLVVATLRVFMRPARRTQPVPLGLLFALLATLGFLALVAFGRGFEALPQNQYAEIQSLLPALLAALALHAFGARAGAALCLGLLVLCGWTYRNQWHFAVHAERTAIHHQTVECSARAWRDWQQRDCSAAFPPWHDFTSDLENARLEEIALYQRTRTGEEPPPAGEFAVGWLEESIYEPRVLRVRGWTAEVGSLRLWSNGRSIAVRHIERFERRRLAQRRGLRDTQPLGFEIELLRRDVPTAPLDGVMVIVDTQLGPRRIPARVAPSSEGLAWADGRRLAPMDDQSSRWQVAEETDQSLRIDLQPPLSDAERRGLLVYSIEDGRWTEELAGDSSSGLLLPRSALQRDIVIAVPQRGFAYLDR